MKVMIWEKIGFRQKSPAYFYALCIASETEKSIRFRLPDGKEITVRRDDLISIEEEEAE